MELLLRLDPQTTVSTSPANPGVLVLTYRATATSLDVIPLTLEQATRLGILALGFHTGATDE